MGLTHSKGPSRAKKVKKYAQKPPGLCSNLELTLSTRFWQTLTLKCLRKQDKIIQRFGNHSVICTFSARSGLQRAIIAAGA